jgi:hypothetical protein
MEEKLDKTDLIAVRPYINEEDRNFILATWLRGLYYGDTFYSQIPKTIFMENYHRILERFVDGELATIKVACLKEDPSVILGYSVTRSATLGEAEISIVDWVFVKTAWRGIGIAKMLTPKKINACTHLTKLGSSIIKHKMPNIIFNPFLL